MSEPDMRKRIVIYGDPVAGFKIVGPFDTADEAIAYADWHHGGERNTWWVTAINPPVPEDET